MRKPSTRAQMFAWHTAAVANRTGTREDAVCPALDWFPECGWFKTSLGRNAPWVAARIYMQRDIDPATGELTEDERYFCDINGDVCDAVTVRAFLYPITRAEYDDLVFATIASGIAQNPRKPFDLTQEPALP